jgi:hypothetical protein
MVVPRRLSQTPRVTFFVVRLLVMHGKDFSPCVVKEGARQCNFTIQKSTVRLDRKRTAKPLRFSRSE